MTEDREAIKSALNSLEPSGETAIADAIRESGNELADNAEENAARFIILLTDGKANVCSYGIPCSEEEAIDDAIEAADYAREWQGTRIYVIGFADQSIIGEYEEQLKEIARDKDDPRFIDECDGEGILCGKYYYAEDTEALEVVDDEVDGIAAGLGLGHLSSNPSAAQERRGGPSDDTGLRDGQDARRRGRPRGDHAGASSALGT